MIFFKVIKRISNSYDRLFCSKQIMKYLSVAEKNDAAKNIAAILSRGGSTRREGFSKYNKIYEWHGHVNGQNTKMVMTSVSGHLLNYAFTGASRSWYSCDPIDLFDAQVSKECPKDYVNIKKTLEREVRYCQGLIIWTDCDREGENIGYEVIEVCKAITANLRVFRAVFSEITSTSIHRALQDLQQPNKNVSDAVDVRQEIDLRTGAAFTRLQTLRLQRSFPENLADKLISYGSCQFPTLGFVVDRYKEIENFIPETFWKIKMSHRKSPVTTDFVWERERLFERCACAAIFDICQESSLAEVLAVDSRPRNKWRPTPLDTIELEKTASRKLRINAKEVMKIAEKLYMQGFISYPRTETDIFPKELQLVPLVEMQQNDTRWGTFAQRILTTYGGPIPRQGRKTDHAHPPIHPTKPNAHLQGNEAKIYEFIVRRFLACVSKDAEGHETLVKVSLGGESFSAKGLLILERHFLDVYIYDTWGDKAIGNYEQNDRFKPSKLEMVEGSTTAPNLLTEADLITLMDRHGIGTDATQADHIETIKQREYVALRDNGRHFVPGTLGMGLVEGYNEIGLQVSLAKPQLRAEFERELKAICDGQKRAEDVRRKQIDVYREVFRQVAQRIARLDAMVGSRLGAGGGPNNGPGFAPGGRGNDPGGGPGSNGGGGHGNGSIGHDRRGGNDDNNDDSGQPPASNRRRIRTPILNVPPCTSICGSETVNNRQQRNIQSSSSTDSKSKLSSKARSPPPLNNRSFSTTPTNRSINNVINSCNNSSTSPNIKEMRTSNLCTTKNSIGIDNSMCAPQRKNGSLTMIDSSRPSTSRKLPPIASEANESGRSVIDSDPIDKFDDLGNRMEFLPPLPIEFQCLNESVGQVVFVLHDQEVVLRARTTYDDQVVCHCGQPAQLLTVRKEGPNQGRPFYKCGGSSQCDMFLWESGDIETGNIAVVAATGDIDMTDRRNSQEIRCNCHQDAVLRTVSKAGPNTGRQFYACPKPMGQGCKFFEWEDELDVTVARPSTSRGKSRRGGRGGWRGRGAKRIGITKASLKGKSHTKKTNKK